MAVWHHRSTGREKYRALELGIKNGSLKVLIGPSLGFLLLLETSALLLLMKSMTLAYKQQEKPHYHARQIALWRGRYNNAVIVLGSATPSLERTVQQEAQHSF